MKKVNLVVVAHPDDEILGFGATGAKLVDNGEEVQALILSGKADARKQRPADQELLGDCLRANELVGFNTPILGDFPNIKMNTVDHLSMVQFIEKYVAQFQPERIFTHHPADLNNDHTQVSKACVAASRLYQRRFDVKRLSMIAYMEILSSTDWSYAEGGEQFHPNLFVESGEFLEQKIRALACYRNVMRPFPHPRSREVLTGLSAYRGAQSGQKYSEAFQCIYQGGL